MSQEKFNYCKQVAQQSGLNNLSSKVITVGGTNGKGTAVAELESILISNGYSVGSFTSPHLFKINERIKLNGEPIPNSIMLKGFSCAKKIIDKKRVSYFGFLTFVALAIFKEFDPDFIILEVGIGGRLDTTNIVDSDYAIITNVALDHVEILGKDRVAIAYEKVGIARANGVLVYGEDNVPSSILNVVDDLNIDLHIVSKEKVSVYLAKLLNSRYGYDLSIPCSRYPCDFSLPGRLQLVRGEIDHLFDVAHNPASAERLSLMLRELNYKRVLAVVGIKHHKLIEETIRPLISVVDRWFVGELELNVNTKDRFKPLVESNSGVVKYSNMICNSYDMALREALPDDLVLVFGSFVTVGKIMKKLSNVSSL